MYVTKTDERIQKIERKVRHRKGHDKESFADAIDELLTADAVEFTQKNKEHQGRKQGQEKKGSEAEAQAEDSSNGPGGVNITA